MSQKPKKYFNSSSPYRLVSMVSKKVFPRSIG